MHERPPAAEILTLGDELSRGEIVDGNSAWLAARLTDLGLDVRFRSGAGDRPHDMALLILQAAARADVVVVSGGLGPTEDDRTVDVACGLLGVAPVMEPEHRRRMEERFARRGFALTPNNLRQVRVPAGAEVLPNEHGLAPGFLVRICDAVLMFLPGVPREMQPMFLNQAAPRLRALCPGAGALLRRTYRVIGLGESHVDHRLQGLVPPAGGPAVTVHYRLAFPEVLVTLQARGPDPQAAQALLDDLDPEVRRRLGGALYSEGEEDLPVVIGRKLRQRGETLTTAESCTGGLIGEMITTVPGSSAWFLGGVIAYANDVKVQVLGVQPETLLHHGAVSEACVIEMAQGARRLLGATYGVAVSGIAGPDGGTADKPVGTVHVAVAGPAGPVARQIFWPGDRAQVRRIAACAALNLLDKILSPERAARGGDGDAPRERL